jgi:adenylylsulfate kinase
MQTTPEACEKRDTKGHYRKARSGEYRYFPGVDVDYEAPLQPEVVINVEESSHEQATEQIVGYLRRKVLKG